MNPIIKKIASTKYGHRILYWFIWTFCYRNVFEYRGQIVEITRSPILKVIRWRCTIGKNLYGDNIRYTEKSLIGWESVIVENSKTIIDEILNTF